MVKNTSFDKGNILPLRFTKLVIRMSGMIKSMVAFTLLLGVGTLAVEYFRKGSIAIEDPMGFGLTILLMGIAGGYIYNWTYEKTKK